MYGVWPKDRSCLYPNKISVPYNRPVSYICISFSLVTPLKPFAQGRLSIYNNGIIVFIALKYTITYYSSFKKLRYNKIYIKV